jgi:acyl-CoA reductase-like NAD-dependent aldehyde dehydrogenase
VHAANTKDVDTAVEAARRAFNGEWRALDTYVRGELLYKLAGLVERHADVLATIDVWDNGTRSSILRVFSPGVICVLILFRYRQDLSCCP